MQKKVFLLILIPTVLLPTLLGAGFVEPIKNSSLTTLESQIVDMVNGTDVYNIDLELEKIAYNHTLSKYSFRAAGSSGANVTADWIVEQFESFGLETHKESFQYDSWEVLSKPTLIIDDDGNFGTTNDQVTINSFQCEHFSWPTSQNGVFGDLVVLPLPAAASYDNIVRNPNPIDQTQWNAIDTTGKILLIGREVRLARSWQETYKNKLSTQTPLAVVYTWWYSFMSFLPNFFSSGGGYPFSMWGTYYWDFGIPVGFVNYDDGLWIRNRESSLDVSAHVKIESVIGNGLHYNVIGKLAGHRYPNKSIIICGHYDTIMASGFCDNGAGTAGVIELARIFAEANQSGLLHPKYTLLFIALAGEELGMVGSWDYVERHKTETSNIVAVINLDCIGSDYLYVTETNPSGEIDLDTFVLEAAEDLGIIASLEPSAASDHEVFRRPTDFGIDATSVESSIMFDSYPLFYMDLWDMGSPGWIHTSYDNSTSTTTLNWVESDDLEDHIKVAALSILRLVHLRGDINGDNMVNVNDLDQASAAFGTSPGEANWNQMADLVNDDLIDIFDIVLIAVEYGKDY